MKERADDKNGVLLPTAVYREVIRLTEGIQQSQTKYDAIDQLHAFARFVLKHAPPSTTAPKFVRTGKCSICQAPYTGVLGLGPCENGHTINEEQAHAEASAPSATRRTHDVLLAITHGYSEWEATGDPEKLVKAINEAEIHRQEIAPPQIVTVADVVPVSDGRGET